MKDFEGDVVDLFGGDEVGFIAQPDAVDESVDEKWTEEGSCLDLECFEVVEVELFFYDYWFVGFK